MLSAAVWRGHAVHFVVFGVPIAVLVGTVARQEIRGRLRERRREAEPAQRPPCSDVATDGLWIAAAGLVAAAAMHAAVISDHFREDARFGMFFAALAIAQCCLAMVLMRTPPRRAVRYVATTSAWVVAL